MLFKALKTGFVENKWQSGPLSVANWTQGKILANCQLSGNTMQTLFWLKGTKLECRDSCLEIFASNRANFVWDRAKPES